jgi:hypothetical protein
MADTVTSNTMMSGVRTKRAIVHLTGISDGTGESAVVKVDRSTLLIPGIDAAPTKLHIASIRWNIQGFSYIKLSWDHTADDTICLLSLNGYENYETYGGLKDPNTSVDAVTGAIGDILLTSVGAASGATYDITLEIILA